MKNFIDHYKAIEALPVKMYESTMKFLETIETLCKDYNDIYKDRNSILQNPTKVAFVEKLWSEFTNSWHIWYKNSYLLTELDGLTPEQIIEKLENVKSRHYHIALVRDRLRNEYPLLNLYAVKLDVVMLGFFLS
jgi:hypothetical protein